ncbi:glutathione S-transferase family protein [Calothrix sp. PCC 6303]|uniref:glutathione S-transferase family protein n=1 Tax=Calothrix sp. PCC 6303 TaxID=1170562 RepID=UPI0002A023B2|nr:glutathione S-transferase family protein [Calothrix sp. PCC 6303]AFZ02173.1 Glutathione S-transferase domain protein [Calothrix sp. PCC 6303]
MINQTEPFRLITIPVSHYCEKARWALTRLKLSYVEEGHIPLFHAFATKRAGGQSTPVLVTEKAAFLDSTDILKYLDSIASKNEKIIPEEPNLRKQAEELEELFDQKLGTAARRWAYSHIIGDNKLIRDAWCNSIPKWEALFFPVLLPILRPALIKNFDINADSAQESYIQIQEIFEKVAQILSDGRQYLVGDKFSIADLTFASLSAPMIQAAEYPKSIHEKQNLPAKMLLEIKQMQETTAGKFALRLYKNERFVGGK